MKIRLFSAIIALSLSVPVLAGSTIEIIENAKKFTVLVTQEGLLSQHSRGSGILLDETHVLTCFHLLEPPSDELFVYTYPLGKVYTAHPDVVDQQNDLAILILNSSATVQIKPIIQTDTAIGEAIYVIGNSLGAMNWRISKGIISSKEHSFLITDALSQHGDSGGPWINEKGEIVALTTWGSEDYPGIVGGIDGNKISFFISSYFHPETFMKKFMEMFRIKTSTSTVK